MRIQSKSVQVILAVVILLFGVCLLAFSLSVICGRMGTGFGEIELANPLFQITSNSMAPRFLGPHYRAVCTDCLQQWSIAAETTKARSLAKCPVCGNANGKLGPLLPGQNVSMRTLSGQPASSIIPRFCCIVFSNEHRSQWGIPDWSCKRVWGLPGEQLELRDGELWINGHLFQKSIDQLLSFAVSVSHFPADPFSETHWKFQKDSQASHEETDSLGQVEPEQGRFFGYCRKEGHQPSEQPPQRLSVRAGWHLTWNYRAPMMEPGEDAVPHSVLDDYWCNDSTARSLVAVDDLLLTIEFDALPWQQPGSGSGYQLLVECEYQGKLGAVLCYVGDGAGPEPTTSLPIAPHPRRLSIGGWDGRMWAQWDSTVALQLDPLAASVVESPRADFGRRSTRFRLVGLRGEVSLSSLRVHRDLHLRYDERDPRNGNPAPARLGPDEYYVIGDNLPISRDSRNGLGCIHRGRIIGVLEP